MKTRGAASCKRGCRTVVAAMLVCISIACQEKAAEKTAKPTEVVIVSTQHFITDMPEGYWPGHLRALLDKIAPTLLLVEAPVNLPDPWSGAPYELMKVTRPWALQRGIPIVSIGWDNPTYQAQINGMMERFTQSGKFAEYENIENHLQSALVGQTTSCATINNVASMSLWRQYHSELHRLYGKQTPWETWNAKILEKAIDACREHAGERIAIVFGAAHAYFLSDGLSDQSAIRLISAENFFPLSEKEVARHMNDEDYLQALRLLNFAPGTLSNDQLVALQKKLDRLGELAKFPNDRALFTAFLLLHERKPSEALTLLSSLSSLPESVLLDYDGITPIRDAARFEMCIAFDEQGATEKVVENLRAIAEDANTFATIRQAAQARLKALQPNK